MDNVTPLYNNGAGSMASLFAGQNQNNMAQQNDATLQKMMMDNQQAAVMNPLEAQMKQAQLANTQATLPGIQGQSMSASAKGVFDVQTLTPRIAESIAQMKSQMSESQVKSLQADGEKIRALSGLLKNYPAAMHAQIAQSFLQKVGGEELMSQFKGVPPEGLQPILESFGNAVALSTAHHVQQSSVLDKQYDTKMNVATQNNEAKIQAAQIAAEARVAAAEKRAAAMEKAMSIEKQVNQLIMKGAARTPEETAQLQQLQAYALTLKAAAAPQTTANVLEQDTPMVAAQNAAKNLTPTNAPKQPAGGDDMVTAAKKAGWAYEPDKYHYRMNNGKLQRAPK